MDVIFGGFVGKKMLLKAAGLMAMGLPTAAIAVTISSFRFGLVDKVLSVLVCYFIIKSMPSHFLVKLPMGSYKSRKVSKSRK